MQGFSLLKQEKWQCNICHFPLQRDKTESTEVTCISLCLPTRPTQTCTYKKKNETCKLQLSVLSKFFFLSTLSCAALFKKTCVSHLIYSYTELEAVPGKLCLRIMFTQVHCGCSFLIQHFKNGISVHAHCRNNIITNMRLTQILSALI